MSERSANGPWLNMDHGEGYKMKEIRDKMKEIKIIVHNILLADRMMARVRPSKENNNDKK